MWQSILAMRTKWPAFYVKGGPIAAASHAKDTLRLSLLLPTAAQTPKTPPVNQGSDLHELPTTHYRND